jgi:hypothetical protein
MRLATRWPTSCAVYVIEAVGPCTVTNRPLIFILLNGLATYEQVRIIRISRSDPTTEVVAGVQSTQRRAIRDGGGFTEGWEVPTIGR